MHISIRQTALSLPTAAPRSPGRTPIRLCAALKTRGCLDLAIETAPGSFRLIVLKLAGFQPNDGLRLQRLSTGNRFQILIFGFRAKKCDSQSSHDKSHCHHSKR